MTLDQLEAFQKVASLGTFAAAARALRKSQPAVSKLVQNLEAELGLALLDRQTYRPTLTDAGRLFFERAARLVSDADELRGFGAALRGDAEPIVRLVLEAITPLHEVLRVLRTVQAVFPTVRYELRTERLAGALEALREARSDLAITSPDGMDAQAMLARPFRGVRILAVAHRDHPLAQARSPVAPRLLRQHPQVVLSDSARADPARTLNVLEGGLRWTVTDIAAKLQIIEAGMGWGGLPEHVVAPSLRAGALVALDVREFHVQTIELSVIRRADRAPGPVARALWDGLGSAAAEQAMR